MRANHPIFQGPLRVEMTFDKVPAWHPEIDPRGTWLVQKGQPGPENDYGVVSDGIGFEDSPDCEVISGGVNSKGPHGLAIGRQANMLQWGFYCAPDRMTDSARHTFLNAIVYMKRFDGHGPLVGKKSRSRGWLKLYIAALRERNINPGYREYLKKKFPAGIVKQHGLDAAKLETWRAANEEYIRGDFGEGRTRKYAVDTDLRELGLSNRKPEFLDFLVKRLGADANDALALKLAARYLGDHGKDAATALAWIKKNRDRLFFSDTGGFRWFVDTNRSVEASATSEGPSRASR